MNNPETIEDILREMREEDIRLSSEDTSKSEKRALRYACEWCAGYADRIESAWKREKAAVEADVMEQCLLNEAARIAVKPVFDQTEFDKAVSKPNGWDAVANPVEEVRKMRGDKEAE